MGAYLESLSLIPENVTGTNVDYLKANNFQLVTANIQVRFETWVSINAEKPLEFGSTDNFTTTDWIEADYPAFQEFAVGDVLVGNGTASNDVSFTITEKPNDYAIRVSGTVTPATEIAGKLHLNQEPLGILFEYGLIENNEGFNTFSKVTGDRMAYEYGHATAIGSSPLTMIPLGHKDWQLGILEGCTVTNDTTIEDRGVYRYIFTIAQVFIVHPFYLYTQLLDILADKAPKYWLGMKALRHVWKLRGLRSLQDPNVYQELIYDVKNGNSGWLDEEYNGGNKEYKIENLVYSNGVGLTRDGSITVTFDVSNTADNTEGLADFVCVSFNLLPESEDQYRGNDLYMYQNYGFDRANQEEGVAAINGELFGTTNEVIKTVTVTAGSGKVSVSAVFDFGTDVQAIIDALVDKRYMITAYAVAAGQTPQSANYVTLLVDLNTIEYDLPAATIDATTELFYHDQNDFTGPVTTPEFNIEDEIVARTEILLDRADYDVQIDKIRGQVVMVKSGESDVVLLEKEYNLAPLPLIGDVRFISSVSATPFKVLSTEIRAEYKCERDSSLDAGNDYGYTLQHPFLLRWAEWDQLSLPFNPADFLDTAEPYNGFNQDWYRLSQLSGWSFFYRVSVDISVQGSSQASAQKTIDTDTALTFAYYDGNADWGSGTIECYDGATQLDYGGQPYIMSKLGGKNTTIRAEFTWLGAGNPLANDIWMEIRIIPKEGGNHISNDTASSVYDRSGISMLSGVGGKITLSNPSGSILRGECEVDYTKLPAGIQEFTISARVGEDSTTL